MGWRAEQGACGAALGADGPLSLRAECASRPGCWYWRTCCSSSRAPSASFLAVRLPPRLQYLHRIRIATGLNSVFGTVVCGMYRTKASKRIPLWKTSASMMWQSLEAALKVLLPSAPPPPSPPSTFNLFGLLNPPPPPPAPARGSPYLVAYVVLVLLSHCWEQCARRGPAREVRGVARVRSDRRLRYVLHFDRLQICAGARGVVSSSRACQIRCGLRSVQSTRRSTRGRRNMARRRTTLAS